jgi:cytoskeletal protein CcmA (bactofilin family)
VIWRRDEPDRAGAELPAAPADAGSSEQGETTTEKVPVRTEVRGMADQGGQGGEVTIVGQGAKLEGTVVSAGSLRIDGQVKGQINAEGDVLLSPQSQVEADIRAQNVVVAGRFKGTITVKGRAELARGGRVDGDVTSKTLVVEDGGIFQGQSIMDQQPAPAPTQKGAAAPPKSATTEAEEAKV